MERGDISVRHLQARSSVRPFAIIAKVLTCSVWMSILLDSEAYLRVALSFSGSTYCVPKQPASPWWGGNTGVITGSRHTTQVWPPISSRSAVFFTWLPVIEQGAKLCCCIIWAAVTPNFVVRYQITANSYDVVIVGRMGADVSEV